MRYVVSFYNKTSIRVDEKTAPAFVQAMKTKDTVLYKSQAFAGASIQLVRPAYKVEAETREEAKGRGEFRCKYGYTHPNRSECGCKDANFPRVLDEQEEVLLKEYCKELSPQLPSGESYPQLVGRVNDGEMIDNSELEIARNPSLVKIPDNMVKLSDIYNAQR